MDEAIPSAVLRAATGHPDATLISCRVEPISGSMGSATGTVARLVGRARGGGSELTFSLVRKQSRPRPLGRHSAGVHDPRHWAYWRREPLAYASGLLPGAKEPLPQSQPRGDAGGPGPLGSHGEPNPSAGETGQLVAPRCFGVLGDTIWLEDSHRSPGSPPAELARVAARRLGRWQAETAVPDVPWLAGHQLAQRIAVSDLDFRAVDVDPRLVAVWERREALLAELAAVPDVLSHGDFNVGNLVAAGDRTVVLDWATFGVSPVGADLAHLALSTLEDVLGDHLAGLGGRFDEAVVRVGYGVTAGLTGASRMHWMRAKGVPVPDGYQEFVLGLLRGGNAAALG